MSMVKCIASKIKVSLRLLILWSLTDSKGKLSDNPEFDLKLREILRKEE